MEEIMEYKNMYLGFTLFTVFVLVYSAYGRKITVGNTLTIEFDRNISKQNMNVFLSITIAISISLIGYDFFRHVAINRDVVYILLKYGTILTVIYAFSLIGTQFSFLTIEIIGNGNRRTQIINRRKILKLGAIWLITGFAFLAFDLGLSAYYHLVYKREFRNYIVNKVNSPEFRDKYEGQSIRGISNYNREERFTEKDLGYALLNNKKAKYVIKGKAGIGKSWMLNKMCGYIFEKQQSANIIFLKAPTDIDVDQALLHNINRLVFKKLSFYTYPITETLAKKFIIIVDALDEVKHPNRNELKLLLARSSNILSNNAIVVTSRPFSDSLGGYKEYAINDLSVDQVDRFLEKRKKMLYDSVCKKEETVSANFCMRMIGKTKIDLKETTDLDNTFSAFLATNDFKKRNNNTYIYLSTFRDIDVIMDLFWNQLYNIDARSNIKSGDGKTQIYEKWLRYKIQRNCKDALKPKDVDAVLERMTTIAKRSLINSTGTSKIRLPKKELSSDYLTISNGRNQILENVLLESNLIVPDPSNDEQYIFENQSIDDYFIAKVASENITSQNITSILQNVKIYDETEVLPFLAGFYSNVDNIFPKIMDSYLKGKSVSEIEKFAKEELPMYFTHIKKTRANKEFFRNYNCELIQGKCVPILHSEMKKNAKLFLELR